MLPNAQDGTSSTRDRLERGKLVAAILAGAWRSSPPPLTPTPEELAEITPRLLATGTASLAWWRVYHSSLRDTPLASQLRQAYYLYTLRASILERYTAQAVVLLRSVGVDPIVAKGWAIARLYPERGLRPYGDIDLHVLLEQYPAAASALLASDSLPAGAVDLHRGFPLLDDRGPDELWRRSQLSGLGSVDIRVLGVEDHLRLLCLHLLHHQLLRPTVGRRPPCMADIALLLESLPPDFDWGYCLSGDGRRSEWVVTVLALAGQLLGADLDAAPEEVRAARLPDWLVRDVLAEWGGGGWLAPRMESYPLNLPGIWGALREHWPSGLEATVRLGGPLNGLPRLPFQLAAFARRALRFAGGGTLCSGRGRRPPIPDGR